MPKKLSEFRNAITFEPVAHAAQQIISKMAEMPLHKLRHVCGLSQKVPAETLRSYRPSVSKVEPRTSSTSPRSQPHRGNERAIASNREISRWCGEDQQLCWIGLRALQLLRAMSTRRIEIS
jgi:hypothetical protein